MTEILIRVMNIIQRVRNMQELNMFAYAVFAVLLIFGIMNCILGYRLLRFWVMLFGFCIGAVAGAFAMYYIDASDAMYYLGAMLAGGIILGIVAFLSYRMGIFILGAGTGLLLSLYILHPTTSFVFFVCILIGIGLGVLGLKFCRQVIIVVTSLAGGVLTGVSAAKLLGLAEFPYGMLISVAAAGIGLLIQFAMNGSAEEEEEDDRERERRRREAKLRREEEEYYDELAYEEMQREAQEQRRERRRKHSQPEIPAENAAFTDEERVNAERAKVKKGKAKAAGIEAADAEAAGAEAEEMEVEAAVLLEERRQRRHRKAVVKSVVDVKVGPE